MTKKILFTLILLLFFSAPARADELKMGVYPSYFNDVKVEQGGNTELKLKVSNISEYAMMSKKQNDEEYKFTVNLKTEVNDENKKLGLDISSWVSYPEKDTIIMPQEKKDIPIRINVPEAMQEGEYMFYIDVTNGNSSMESNVANIGLQFTSLIKVPVYITVINKETKTDTLTQSCIIDGFDIEDNIPTLDTGRILKTIFSAKHSFTEKLNMAKYTPFKLQLGFGDRKKTYYDIPKIKNTRLGDTLTREEINKNKYILVSGNIEDNDLIERITYNDNKILFQSKDRQSTLSVPEDDIYQKIIAALKNLSSMVDAKQPYKWFLDTIQVPFSTDYKAFEITAKCSVKNTGTKTLVPIGLSEIYSFSNEKISSQVYQSTLLPPETKKEISAVHKLDISQIKDGSYTIINLLAYYKGSPVQTKEFKIHIQSIRYIIMISAAVLLILIGILIFKLAKIYFNKKH